MAFHRGESVSDPRQQGSSRGENRVVIGPSEALAIPRRHLPLQQRDSGQCPPGSGGGDRQSGRSGQRPVASRSGEGPAVVQPPAAVDVLLRAQVAPYPRFAGDEALALPPALDHTAVQGHPWLGLKALAGCHNPLG